MRVVIADDHAVVRETLRLVLQTQADIEPVADVGDGRAAIEACERLHPDVVIMDAAMPGLSGLEATRQLRRRLPSVRVLILTGYGGDDEVINALAAGAAGFVSKTASVPALMDAIRTVHERGRYLPADIIEHNRISAYLGTPKSRRETPSVSPLTEREREVLQLIAEGLSGRAIADRLSISTKTVDVHRDHVAAKLGTRNRMDLVRYAVRNGLVHIDSALADRPVEE